MLVCSPRANLAAPAALRDVVWTCYTLVTAILLHVFKD
jgi:hypothetical protein